MKKIYSLLFVLLISLFFIPNVYAADNVSIESVTLDSKSDSAEVVNEASFEGLNIKFDVKAIWVFSSISMAAFFVYPVSCNHAPESSEYASLNPPISNA